MGEQVKGQFYIRYTILTKSKKQCIYRIFEVFLKVSLPLKDTTELDIECSENTKETMTSHVLTNKKKILA